MPLAGMSGAEPEPSNAVGTTSGCHSGIPVSSPTTGTSDSQQLAFTAVSCRQQGCRLSAALSSHVLFCPSQWLFLVARSLSGSCTVQAGSSLCSRREAALSDAIYCQ